MYLDEHIASQCQGFQDWVASILIHYPGWVLDFDIRGRYLHRWPNQGEYTYDERTFFPQLPSTHLRNTTAAIYYSPKVVTESDQYGIEIDMEPGIMNTNAENIHKYEDECREFTKMTLKELYMKFKRNLD